jgi:hypothetical protein
MVESENMAQGLFKKKTQNLNSLVNAHFGRTEKIEVYRSKDDYDAGRSPKKSYMNTSSGKQDFRRDLETNPQILDGFHVLHVGSKGSSIDTLNKNIVALDGRRGWAPTVNAYMKEWAHQKGEGTKANVQGIEFSGEARKQFGKNIKRKGVPYSDNYHTQKALTELGKEANAAILAADTDTVINAAESDYVRFRRFMKPNLLLSANKKQQQIYLASWVANNIKKGGDLGKYAKHIALVAVEENPSQYKKLEEEVGERPLKLISRLYKRTPEKSQKGSFLINRKWNEKVGKGKHAEDFYERFMKEKIHQDFPELLQNEELWKEKIMDMTSGYNGAKYLQEWSMESARDLDSEKLNEMKSKLNLGGPKFSNESVEDLKAMPKSTRNKVMAVALGYSEKGNAENDPVKYMQKKIASDKEVESIFRRNRGNMDVAATELRDYLSSKYSVDYNEYVRDYGRMSKQERDKILSSGININHLPDIFPGEKEIGGGWRSGGSGGFFKSSGPLKRTARTSLFGTTKTKLVEGEVKSYKEQGRIGRAFSNAGETIKTKIKPTAADIERKHKKEPYWTVMSESQKKKLTVSRWPSRMAQVHKAKRMYGNDDYAYMIKRKERDKLDRQSAKYIQTEREGEMRKKAASSAWWRLYYWGTHNVKVLLGIVLAIAVLFIPIGMFYVAGWALAVGAVTLIMFIVWVFMEFWWFIAQGIVSVINVVSQLFVGLTNWIGMTLLGRMGMSYTPMKYTLVENMRLAEIDPITGQRRILGMTWGQWNLVPPSFMKLDSFMPKTFDTDPIIAKLLPAAKDLFNWFWGPIADRYTAWIETAPWYYCGAIIGVPLLLIIVAVVVIIYSMRRRLI